MRAAGAPGGQDTRRQVPLTLEAGVQLSGLAGARVLADDLLEADLGDLDEVPRGEAALVPADLVDGTCGGRASVSPLGRGHTLGGLCSVLPSALPLTPAAGSALPGLPLPRAAQSRLSLRRGHLLWHVLGLCSARRADRRPEHLDQPSGASPSVLSHVSENQCRGAGSHGQSHRAEHPPGAVFR